MTSVPVHKNGSWSLLLVLIVVVGTPVTFAYLGSGKLSGPYEIKVERLAECEDNGKGLFKFTSKISKVNKTHFAFDINWKINIEFNDDLNAVIQVSKWTSLGGWSLNAFNYISKTPCSDCAKHGKSNFVEFLSKAGLQPRCPIPKGSYKTSGLILKDSLDEFPEMPYGKYKLEVIYKNKAKVKIGCWSAYFELSERV